MVKLTPREIPQFLKSPPENIWAVVVYGPDHGLIREHARTLAQTVVEDINDPFRTTTLTSKKITADPALLPDEANSISLTGGRRLIKINDATDSLTKPLTESLNSMKSDTMIILEAGDLPKSSSLRRLAEKNPHAAALPCYADDPKTLNNIITTTLNAAGLQPSHDAKLYLITNLGNDRRVTLSQLNKVILYMGGQGIAPSKLEKTPLTLEDVQEAIGTNSAANVLEDVVYATASKNCEDLERALDISLANGETPIQILRAHVRHFQNLRLATGYMQETPNINDVLNKLSPPIFFKRRDAFKIHMRLWSLEKLISALKLLEHTEIQCKSTGMPAVVLCRRCLIRLTVKR